ncbi:hypothetical protein Salmuc_00734 [Salipiger mucosus DSM 16094]|uniref:DUF5666 domain-containing protein n=2 Tax=Salipiger mucosus TaxID=263378 RepID=S9Q442_9RHOB|nr:hypothetical protein Salmuc_00734 [Salipiger mucosus DSM 16094]
MIAGCLCTGALIAGGARAHLSSLQTLTGEVLEVQDGRLTLASRDTAWTVELGSPLPAETAQALDSPGGPVTIRGTVPDARQKRLMAEILTIDGRTYSLPDTRR